LQYNKGNDKVLFVNQIGICMPNTKANSIVEIGPEFYDRWNSFHLDLGEAEKDLIIFTDGLSALEKRLMQEVDDKFYNETKKRLPEYLQRRDAKSDNRYIQTLRAKASAQARRIVLKGKIEMMKMQFEAWRTRAADRRYSI
jgi:hypothetical protein